MYDQIQQYSVKDTKIFAEKKYRKYYKYCEKDAFQENWQLSNSFHKWEVRGYQKSKWRFAVPKVEMKIVKKSKKTEPQIRADNKYLL